MPASREPGSSLCPHPEDRRGWWPLWSVHVAPEVTEALAPRSLSCIQQAQARISLCLDSCSHLCSLAAPGSWTGDETSSSFPGRSLGSRPSPGRRCSPASSLALPGGSWLTSGRLLLGREAGGTYAGREGASGCPWQSFLKRKKARRERSLSEAFLLFCCQHGENVGGGEATMLPTLPGWTVS